MSELLRIELSDTMTSKQRQMSYSAILQALVKSPEYLESLAETRMINAAKLLNDVKFGIDIADKNSQAAFVQCFPSLAHMVVAE